MIADRLEISLLFTDIELPGLNGQDLVKHVSKLRPGLPVLYTTGYATSAVVHRGILDANTASLNKPYTLTELAARVRASLDAVGTVR